MKHNQSLNRAPTSRKQNQKAVYEFHIRLALIFQNRNKPKDLELNFRIKFGACASNFLFPILIYMTYKEVNVSRIARDLICLEFGEM